MEFKEWLRQLERDNYPELPGAPPWSRAVELLEVAWNARQPEIDILKEQLETERMRLAACGVVAMSNTRESLAKQSLEADSPYISASYTDVLRAVSAEIKYREALQKIAGSYSDLGHGMKTIAKQALGITP